MISHPTQSIVIDCTYSTLETYWTLSNTYSCAGWVEPTGDSRVVSAVKGDHLEGKSNRLVQDVSLKNQLIKVFPRNLSSFFKNLEAIHIYNSGLEQISKEDLLEFPRLRQLAVNYNKIKEVDGNLFQNNPRLQAISFGGNPIKHVGHQVFDGLANLKYLHFYYTTCIDQRSDNNLQRMENLLFNLTVYCPPTYQMIEDRVMEKLKGKCGCGI
jgi:hypothetical protein